MNQQKKTGLVLGLNLALVFTCVMAIPAVLTDWPPVHAQVADPAVEKSAMNEEMMRGCEEMKEQKQKMKEDIKAQDTVLSEDLAKMNAAPEDQKLNMMAAAFTRMVEEHRAMDVRKATMEEAMMSHMMQHMQMGMDSTPKCPMMKGMEDMKEPKVRREGAHNVHPAK